mgnify:CR=1 FL=1
MSEEAKPIPQAAPPAAEGAPAEGAGEQSKKGAKKAEAKAKKEAEKARKAAEREAAAKASGAGAAAEDLAKDNYGSIAPNYKSEAKRVRLEEITEQDVGQLVKIRGTLQNSRMQGAKIAFFQLGKGVETIQGVMAVSPEGKPISRQMVKWMGTVKLESIIMVEALVQKPLDPVKSCSISGFELHVQKLYIVASAPETLSVSVATASGAVGSVEEEDDLSKATEGMYSAIYSFRGKIANIKVTGLSVQDKIGRAHV